MRHNYTFDNIDSALPVLMADLVYNGDEFGSRAGLTRELMHVGITLDHPWQREITLPSRKASIAAQIVETMWVLSGHNDVATLAPYLPRAADFSDDGVTWRSGYGTRLRNYRDVDQLGYIVKTLRDNPGSRQAVATLWDPAVDATPGIDIACNNWLSFSARHGWLDLHVGIRSNDAMWGWSGINAFEWSALLEVVAALTGLRTGALHFSTTSFHLYEQHWDKAERIAEEDMFRADDLADSPRFGHHGATMHDLDALIKLWFVQEQRIRTGQPVDVDSFPEPMLRSWLRVLQWYWSADEQFLAPLHGTRLYTACKVAIQPAGKPQEPTSLAEPPAQPDFLTYVNNLHAEKHVAYGDSWKRRGEAGILGNIARKVDRMETGLDTSDETQADTAIDLLVYLAKYRCWVVGLPGDPDDVRLVLAGVQENPDNTLGDDFDKLNQMGLYHDPKTRLVDRMLGQALSLARSLWRG